MKPLLIGLVLIIFAAMLGGQTVYLLSLVSCPDVAGTSATVAVFPAGAGPARVFSVVSDYANTSAIRCGGPTTSATAGSKIPPGGSYSGPPAPVDPRWYNSALPQGMYFDLSTVYCYVPTGNSVSMSYSR